MSSRYLYVALLGLVALSKEFLVFNEEVLVLLAFAIFIYLLVNYGGEMIAAELDSRKDKIKEEFITFFRSPEAKIVDSIVKFGVFILNMNVSKNVNFNYIIVVEFERFQA